MQPINTKGALAPIQVQIISNDHFFSAGLKAFSEECDDIEIAGMLPSLPPIELNLGSIVPEVFVISSSSLQFADRSLIRDLKSAFCDSKLIVISAREDSIFAERAFREGASGFFYREVTPADLFDGIRRVNRGELAVEAELAPVLLSRIFFSEQQASSKLQELSNREREVFELVGAGVGTRDIAKALHISVKTVETHQARIKKKLGLNKGKELVHVATQWLTSERIQNA